MKIKQSDYDHLARLLDGIDKPDEVLTEADRWDTFHTVPGIYDSWMMRVYTYANDDHIDTALRRYFANRNNRN